MNSPFTVRALQDLVEIWYSIARDSPTAADGVIDDIHRHAAFVRDHPTIGDIVPCGVRRVRATAVGSYVIYYRDEAKRVAIIRVLHGARDFRPLIDE